MTDFAKLLEAEIPRLRRYARALTRDVTRADEMQPGLISQQIIASVVNADLVVADLTDRNANAHYELALCYNDLGVEHTNQRQLAEALRAYQRARTLRWGSFIWMPTAPQSKKVLFCNRMSCPPPSARFTHVPVGDDQAMGAGGSGCWMWTSPMTSGCAASTPPLL